MTLRFKTVPGRGRQPAVEARHLQAGDVALLPYKGRAMVTSVVHGAKVVHINLRGVERDLRINVWKKRRTLVALERHPGRLEGPGGQLDTK